MATSTGEGEREGAGETMHAEQISPSTAVEMSNLSSNPAEEARQADTIAGAEQHFTDIDHASPPSDLIPASQPAPESSEQLEEKPATSELPTSTTRKQSEALGPATDLPIAALSPPATAGTSVLSITLMLTTGARHPYKIDERYLRNRKVEAIAADGSFDPREISAYQLKELIWTDWRAEWEPRPASPSAIRLIILGRLLDDKNALKDAPFKLQDTNVVHMTVKPADFLEDDDATAKMGKGHVIRGRDGEERGPGCRCVIL